ncbi:MAG TPA: PQQ-binding-like beta-propeller repeat protein [Acidobacteriota bacterium]|nr:PQQ-binding-like beta-propeller repeat protein [Acidobacteriota bacterium]
MKLKTNSLAVLLAAALCAGTLLASEWPHWRGPHQNGVSDETGLISTWSKDGENLIWNQPFTGRSTPVVFDGRACANGRIGEGIDRQEMVACYDAETGEQLWEHRFTVFQTTVPWNRVGWPNLAADPDTGYLYVQGVGGTFKCLDRHGDVVWEKSLVEELGFYSGYGGRTQTPIVDQDRLIVTFSNAAWGSMAAPSHRVFAFDKRTGEPLWISAPGRRPADLNSQSTPVVAVIEGRRQVIFGNGDGWIYSLDSRTGEKIWEFQLSQRAINTTVVVDGHVVYASHSEENIDEGTMGRVVAIDARGSGNVTTTHELWRSPVSAGFSSLIKKDDRIYVVDNSANLHALNAENGQHIWEHSLGRVGKSSPVWADGKIYATEVNGNFVIVQPGEEGAVTLDLEQLNVESGERYAEIYGSPAIAYGRIYFTTEAGIYCLGDENAPFEAEGSGMEALPDPVGPAEISIDAVRIAPAEVRVMRGDSHQFRAMAFDQQGFPLGARQAQWTLDGLSGEIDAQGNFTPAAQGKSQFGLVKAKIGEAEGQAYVRVYSPMPMMEDFESLAEGERPDYQLGALAFFGAKKLEDGNTVLVKNPAPRGIHKHDSFLGPAHWRNYTIQADLYATRTRRRIPDMGLVNSGYTMDLMAALQQIQVRSWASELRMAVEVPFEWEPERWYTMKLRVDQEEGKAVVRGKVWPKGTAEPAEWTISVEDPHPVTSGSPGIFGFSMTPVYYDNVKVVENE